MKFLVVLIPMLAALTMATPTPVNNGLTAGLVHGRQEECRALGASCSNDEQCCGDATCEGIIFAFCED
ncbi:unnamed protein product [Rhizoctonia solani]|nr:unnamed protein product [Rhizoctonia solani]